MGVSSKDAEFRQFMTDPVILIAPLDHPWAQMESIEPTELCEVDCILREEGSGTLTAVLESLEEVGVGIDNLNTLLTLGNSEAIALAVQEGLGVGFVSSLVFDRLVKRRVAPIKIHGVSICRDIYIGQQICRPATAAQTTFWDFICSLERADILLSNFEQALEEISA